MRQILMFYYTDEDFTKQFWHVYLREGERVKLPFPFSFFYVNSSYYKLSAERIKTFPATMASYTNYNYLFVKQRAESRCLDIIKPIYKNARCQNCGNQTI